MQCDNKRLKQQPNNGLLETSLQSDIAAIVANVPIGDLPHAIVPNAEAADVRGDLVPSDIGCGDFE